MTRIVMPKYLRVNFCQFMKSMRLGDRELLVVHKSVVNLHSLAYVVESGTGHHVHAEFIEY